MKMHILVYYFSFIPNYSRCKCITKTVLAESVSRHTFKRGENVAKANLNLVTTLEYRTSMLHSFVTITTKAYSSSAGGDGIRTL